MKNTLEYKGYLGTVEYSNEDNCLYGKIIGIDDLVNYEAQSVEELSSSQVKIWQQSSELRIDNRLEPMHYTMLYVSGALVSQGIVQNGYQAISLPEQTGIYILQFNSSLGTLTKKVVLIR